jgi:quercetin dioxygenase-like cupin family protein
VKEQANMVRARALLLTATVAMSMMPAAVAQAQLAGTKIPGGCDVMASARTAETGCFLVATTPLGKLPSASVFWHLYRYPTRAAAEAAKGTNSTVVDSLGHIWVYTIAAKDWRPSAGERVDVLGPLQVSPDKPYTARYMEAVFAPGMQTSVHRHSGAEAWYVLTGAQCLETPDRIIVAKAGEGAVVPQGPPMALSGVGTEIRRSVLLVLHESSEPWMTVTSDWAPTGRCPK